MGVDGDKAESVVNLTNNRQGVLWTANLFLVAGAATLWRAISTLVCLGQKFLELLPYATYSISQLNSCLGFSTEVT